jgi:hypothetical protein
LVLEEHDIVSLSLDLKVAGGVIDKLH